MNEFPGEINGLIDPKGYHEEVTSKINGRRLYWTDPRLAKVTRLRLISDPNPMVDWDVSYCHGVDVDGNPVDVSLPFNQLPKRGKINGRRIGARGFIVEYAKKDGVHAKGLGILDAISSLL